MQDTPDEEGIPIQIQFEFLNANEEMELSQIYTVKIQPTDDFEANRFTMINSCDFRTQEERIYYYMFDKVKKIFLPNNTNLLNLCKNNKVIIMENCKTFSEQICEKLREETADYKKYKNETQGQEDLKKSQSDSKKNEIRMIRYLESNFQVDLFAKEFISNNGIQYLDTIIKYNSGNIRTYSLQGLSTLLDYQSAFDYFEKKREILFNLYNILMSNDNLKSSKNAIDIMIKIIGKNVEKEPQKTMEKTMYIIDVAEKYAKKSHTKIYSQIVNFLSDTNKEVNLRNNSLIFINMIMTFCHPSILSRILIQLRDEGIFEFLEKSEKKHDEKFDELIKNFIIKTEAVLTDSDYEVEIYKKRNRRNENSLL